MDDYIPDEQVNRFKISKKKKKRLPPHVIRQIYRNSKEGGRGRCFICKESFSMKFIVNGYLRSEPFGEEKQFCRDCAKEHYVIRS